MSKKHAWVPFCFVFSLPSRNYSPTTCSDADIMLESLATICLYSSHIYDVQCMYCCDEKKFHCFGSPNIAWFQNLRRIILMHLVTYIVYDSKTIPYRFFTDSVCPAACVLYNKHLPYGICSAANLKSVCKVRPVCRMERMYTGSANLKINMHTKMSITACLRWYDVWITVGKFLMEIVNLDIGWMCQLHIGISTWSLVLQRGAITGKSCKM